MTGVGFRGLILYFFFLLLGKKLMQGHCPFLQTVLMPYPPSTIHLSSSPKHPWFVSLLMKKALLAIFILKLTYDLVMPELKPKKFFPNGSEPLEWLVHNQQTWKCRALSSCFYCCVPLFPKSEGEACFVVTQCGGCLSSMLRDFIPLCSSLWLDFTFSLCI